MFHLYAIKEFPISNILSSRRIGESSIPLELVKRNFRNFFFRWLLYFLLDFLFGRHFVNETYMNYKYASDGFTGGLIRSLSSFLSFA